MFNLLLASTFDPSTLYTVMTYIFIGLMVVLSIGMIIIVLLQQGTGNNLGSISGGGDSFFGKNKQRSLDGKLKIATVVVAAGLMVCAILFFVFYVLLKSLG